VSSANPVAHHTAADAPTQARVNSAELLVRSATVTTSRFDEPIGSRSAALSGHRTKARTDVSGCFSNLSTRSLPSRKTSWHSCQFKSLQGAYFPVASSEVQYSKSYLCLNKIHARMNTSKHKCLPTRPVAPATTTVREPGAVDKLIAVPRNASTTRACLTSLFNWDITKLQAIKRAGSGFFCCRLNESDASSSNKLAGSVSRRGTGYVKQLILLSAEILMQGGHSEFDL